MMGFVFVPLRRLLLCVFKFRGGCLSLSYYLTAISLESLILWHLPMCVLMTNIKQTCFELHSD